MYTIQRTPFFFLTLPSKWSTLDSKWRKSQSFTPSCLLSLSSCPLLQVSFYVETETFSFIYVTLGEPILNRVTRTSSGLLADKFNSYKPFLVGLVALTATFHTLLLIVDARIPPDSAQVSTRLLCSQNGITIRFPDSSNGSTCSSSKEVEEAWTGSFVPSECQPVTCTASQTKRMKQCSSDDDDCLEVSLYSRSKWSLKLDLFQQDEAEPRNCTARVHEIMETPSSLVCDCLIQCPAKLKLASQVAQEKSNATLIKLQAADRLKHQQGFWTYFVLRIIASSTLAASFSMYS